MCLGAAVLTGATVVLRYAIQKYYFFWRYFFLIALFIIRKKFSVRNFAADCAKYNCTVFQYIGELCRYLANSPPTADEDKMHLNYAFGNGLRPDVWEKFKQRFRVKNIVEFYGATEGTLALYNSVQKVGALGYIPPFLSRLHPARYF